MRNTFLLRTRKTPALARLAALAGCVCLAAPARPALAQPFGAPVPGYVHRLWTTQEGLPQNTARALTQTRDGYLWVGTGSGLVRYDGVTFTVFDMLNTPELPSNWVSALYEDPTGTLWVGTDKGFACYRNGRFTRGTVPVESPSATIRAVLADRAGRLWVATTRSVMRWDADHWTVLPLGAVRVGSLLIDRDDTVWVGTENGLIEWRDNRVARRIQTKDGLPAVEVRAIVRRHDGELWLGTTGGVARLDVARGVALPVSGPLSGVYVNTMIEDDQGQLWVGSTGAIGLLTKSGQSALHSITTRPDGGQVASLLRDRDGHLWFGVEGGSGGLHRLSSRHVTVFAQEQGYQCDNVVPVTQTTDGTIWTGNFCNDGGGMVSLRGGKVELWRGRAQSPSWVLALLAEPDGTLWAAGYSTGLRHYKNGVWTRYEVPVTDTSASPVTDIVSLLRDREGALWLATTGGLLRWHQGKWTTFRVKDGLPSDDVRTLVAGLDGTLWIGTSAGLSHYVNGTFQTLTPEQGLPRGAVRALHVDAHGTLWIGTYGGGLARMKDGRITRFGTQDGLLDTAVHRILEDDGGYLWLSGDRGIRRVSRRELDAIAEGRVARVSVRLFDESEGMPSAETNGMGQPAGWKGQDGALWFPTQGGLVRIDPNAGEQALPPPVAIETVALNGGVQPVSDANVTAPPGVTDLAFRYTAPTFIRAEQVQFRYRLHGYDKDWIYAGDRREAHYGNLPPGEYRFEVIARGSDGEWTGKSVTLGLVLQPYLHQRLGFRIGLGLLAALGLAGAFRWRTRQLSRRARRLAEQVEERTAELRHEREELSLANDELSVTNRQLQTAKSEIEASHIHLLSVLEQLRIGVIIVNPREEVLFVSHATCKLIAGDDVEIDEDGGCDAVLGRPLDQILPMTPELLAEVRALVASPRQGARVTTELRPKTGQRYWTEIEVRPDPRDPGNRLLYLYDVTETYDLKQAMATAGAGAPGAPARAMPLTGVSAAIRMVQTQIVSVAGVDTTVLIEGETGTGKELVARAIHRGSRRKDRPFVAINCAGLTESLLASQLFGHRRGAFTGAVADHVGLFEAAQGGTLLLDEIGDMPMSVQTHLLRVLQEREILRVGESRPRAIDVRVLAATHRSLEQEVAEGRFREDLFYRIRVVRIVLPPLRRRPEDIPLLATSFLEHLSTTHGTKVNGIGREAMERLMAHRWPGNVRELKSVIEGAVIRAGGPVIKVSDLMPELTSGAASESVPPPRGPMSEAERRLLIDTLRRTGGNRSVAARLLGVSRATLYRRLAAMEVSADDDSTA